jgi:hypothetical protein
LLLLLHTRTNLDVEYGELAVAFWCQEDYNKENIGQKVLNYFVNVISYIGSLFIFIAANLLCALLPAPMYTL